MNMFKEHKRKLQFFVHLIVHGMLKKIKYLKAIISKLFIYLH